MALNYQNKNRMNMEYFKYLNNIACIEPNHEEILKMMQNILHALFFLLNKHFEGTQLSITS